MKPINLSQVSSKQSRVVVALGIASALLIATVACSHESTPVVNASQPVAASVQSVAAKSAEAKPELVAASVKAPRPQSSMLTFKSRDYGVSFEYPWQYARIGPRALAQNAELRPALDGHEGQFTLVRINVPRGFYPDTNYQSGYFTLSLNQDLDEKQCIATLPVTKSEVQTEVVNGTEFRWVESESGGSGSSATLRNYVAYSGGTCYEIEAGVKTQNDMGLSREVDPAQVMRRLDAILQTVKINPGVQTAVLEPVDEEE